MNTAAGNLDPNACPKTGPKPSQRKIPRRPGSRAEPNKWTRKGIGHIQQWTRGAETTVGSSRPPPKWQIGHDRQHPPNVLTPTRGMGPPKPAQNGLRNAALPKESDAKSFEHGPPWPKVTSDTRPNRAVAKCPGTPSQKAGRSTPLHLAPSRRREYRMVQHPNLLRRAEPSSSNRQPIGTS